MASYHLNIKTGGKGRASSHADYIGARESMPVKKNADSEHKESGNMPA